MGNSLVPPLSLGKPSEGISNAWDFQEISDCQSQELRLLSGIRDIFSVKAIVDWLNLQGAKLNHEVHSKATRRRRKGRKAGKGWGSHKIISLLSRASERAVSHTEGDLPSPGSLQWLVASGEQPELCKPPHCSARDLFLRLSLLDHGRQVAGTCCQGPGVQEQRKTTIPSSIVGRRLRPLASVPG